jgi:hypothetical protein
VPHPSRRHPQPTLPTFAAAAAILVWLSAGCSPASRIRPDDIRSYTVARNAEPAAIVAAPDSPAPANAPAADRRVRYVVPDGWTEGEAGGMRLATLFIGDPAERREVTIIPASGTLESNVERWQGQLDTDADAAALKDKAAAAIAAAETVEIDGVAAKVVLLRDAAATDSADSGQAILAAVIPLDATGALFVKFKGDAAVAARERDRFAEFVASIRWKN